MRIQLLSLLAAPVMAAFLLPGALPPPALPGAAAAGSVSPAGSTDPVGEWPLRPEPEVVHAFDPPADPWGSGHRGVDLAGRAGQHVRAALAGRVAYAGRLAGRGVVTVEHDGTRTTYEPVEPTVAVGDRVVAGQPLGQLEVTSSHCFPAACLHWGWLRGETYLDPLRLVGAGPVRLLPLWREDPVTLPGASARAALPYAAWSPPVARPAGWLP